MFEKLLNGHKTIDIISVNRYNNSNKGRKRCIMYVDYLISQKKITKYKVAVETGMPHATLSDICSGKTNLLKCSAETLYKLSKVLGVSMEDLIVGEQRPRSYEYGLPTYLQHDLDEYKKGLANKSPLLDCLWGELYGSINIAEIDDGKITPDHADYLRKKFLRGKVDED